MSRMLDQQIQFLRQVLQCLIFSLLGRISKIRDVFGGRLVVLASHHFPVTAILDVRVPQSSPRKRVSRLHLSALKDPATQHRLALELQAIPASSPVDVDIDAAWEGWYERVNSLISKVIPVNVPVAKRPWISSGTLRLISAKRSARENGNWPEEKRLRKTVQVAVRKDKADWLENLVASQGWNAVKYLKKGPRKQEGHLKNYRGELVDSDLRAEIFAEYLENIQWRVRPAILIPDLEPPLCTELPVSLDPFTMHSNLLLQGLPQTKLPNKVISQVKCSKLFWLLGLPKCFG